jgi:hypothetical protein
MVELKFKSWEAFQKVPLQILKMKFLEKQCLNEKGEREIAITVDVAGDEFTYGVRYFSNMNVAMRFEIIFEMSQFDDNIECCPELRQCHTADEAWAFLEEQLKEKFGN